MTNGMANVIRRWNRELDRLDLSNQEMIITIGRRLDHWHKYRKYPQDLIDAMVTKFTKILNKTWYDDEPEQEIINKYLWLN